MPTKLRTLKAKALQACTSRGHKMSRFHNSIWSHNSYSKCYHCYMEVCVNDKPAPNDIDISGEAVALNCKHNYQIDIDNKVTTSCDSDDVNYSNKMLNKIRRLKVEARKRASTFDHDIKRFKTLKHLGDHYYMGTCVNCNAHIIVDMDPGPCRNVIHGLALIYTCKEMLNRK